MANQYNDRPAGGQPVRTARPANAGTRPAQPARPAQASRPASSSTRTAQQSRQSYGTPQARPVPARPANNGTRRPAPAQANRRPQPKRRKKPNGRFYALIALLVVIIVAVIAIVAITSGRKDPTKTVVQPTQAPVVSNSDADTQTSTSHADSLAAMLGDQDAVVEGLSADQMAVVSDLSINTSLPTDEWINILMLGSDERSLSESARTDSMIICSINKKTGEVKLSSIMRDLAVPLNDIGANSGTYRINAANYFGGERLAMKIVNQCFGMNIENYVRVNFYGFQQVAQALGGIEMDITQEEMNLINERIVEQAKFAYWYGIDESALPNQFLETYGPNTHLDGRQTLAYARLRKLDGGDFARAERQRNVLTALMNKLKGAGAGELLAVGTSCLQHIRTNMSLDDMLAIATTVCGNGITSVESFRLPINDSYVQETRNEQSMFYDCDWARNASELYNFIYE